MPSPAGREKAVETLQVARLQSFPLHLTTPSRIVTLLSISHTGLSTAPEIPGLKIPGLYDLYGSFQLSNV